MAVGSHHLVGPDIARMSAYEEHITGLISFRNALEALTDSWPRGRDGRLLPASGCSPQQRANVLGRLDSLKGGYRRTVRSWSHESGASSGGSEARMMTRPAGLPARPRDDGLEESLLAQVSQLLDALLELEAL